MSILIIYLISYLASLPLIAGIIVPETEVSGDSLRRNLGFAYLISMILALFGPIGILITLFMSGFAEKGFRFK